MTNVDKTDDGMDRLNIDPWIKNMIRSGNQAHADNRPAEQFRLGTLIDRLGAIDDQSLEVRFDFGYNRPVCFESWRGLYAELALTYSEEYGTQHVTVSGLLAMAKEADGEVFEGYKGGDFQMGRETPLWVANYGNANNTIITDIEQFGWWTCLHTRWQDD